VTPPAARCYFEDVEVGEEVVTPGLTLTETHAKLYRGLTGDEGAAADTVPDLLPLCVSTGLGWRVARPPLVVLAFIGIEWRILRTARVGDTVHSRSRMTAKRSMRDAGVIITENEIVDQRGDVVQSGRFTYLVAKRPAVDKESPHGV
jgi:acyl dehydratase